MRLAVPVPAAIESNLQSLGFDPDVVRKIQFRLQERGLIVIAGGNSVRRGYVLRALADDLLRDGRRAMTAGEPSNADLCAAAVAAALRGDLVLITLPAADAASARRILGICGARADAIARAMRSVIIVHWLRKLCRSCAEPIGRMTSRERVLSFRYAVAPLFRARGCERCSSTGFSSEIPLVHFTDNPPNPADEDHTLDAAVDLVSRGETTIDELGRVLGSPKRQRSSF